MTIFVTSDTHFGHKNIIKYCNRPFVSIDHMDEKLIDNINTRARSSDFLIHCGDFAFSSPRKYLSQIEAQMIILLGNHDSEDWWTKEIYYTKHHPVTVVIPPKLKLSGIDVQPHAFLELVYDDKLFVLCHYAMRVWNASHHGSFMLFGHSHDTLSPNNQSCDVGVDSWANYKPVTLDECLAHMNTLPQYINPDHHSPRTNP